MDRQSTGAHRPNATGPCHLCGETRLVEITGFAALTRVTSDCRGYPSGGRLGVCEACALVQKVVDAQWQQAAAAIYQDYALYHQTRGQTEQLIFDGAGLAAPRSRKMFESALKQIALPKTGTLLDVGCGNGATLQAASTCLPSFRLLGIDPHLRSGARVAAIPGVSALYSDWSDIQPGLDLVTLVHVLEHVPHPGELLRKIRSRLRPDGHLMLQVPYFVDNPFDLVIADHCSHFTRATLGRLLRSTGFELVLLSSSVLPKELTVIARRTAETVRFNNSNAAECDKRDAAGSSAPSLTVDASPATRHQKHHAAARAAVRWLTTLTRACRRHRAGAPAALGVFGTSIGGNWLVGVLNQKVDLFVDEDPGRIGRTLHGCPVVAPSDVPGNATVLMPLPSTIAAAIRERLGSVAKNYVVPPRCVPSASI